MSSASAKRSPSPDTVQSILVGRDLSPALVADASEFSPDDQSPTKAGTTTKQAVEGTRWPAHSSAIAVLAAVLAVDRSPIAVSEPLDLRPERPTAVSWSVLALSVSVAFPAGVA
jgi:hypothetical protein